MLGRFISLDELKQGSVDPTCSAVAKEVRESSRICRGHFEKKEKIYLETCKNMEISGGSRISRRGGVDLVGGAWTPEAVMFQNFCMPKWKNLDP